VLFPSYEGGEDKVLQIANSIIPFTTTKYAAKLGADLYFAIRKANKKEALEIIRNVEEGSNTIEKCLAIVAIDGNKDKREELYRIYDEHILLKNRIYDLKTKLESANMIREMIIKHNRRVLWQIQRIYRTRNLIIHSGKSLPFINALVENVHSYLDRVLDILMEETSRSDGQTSIDQICAQLKLQHDSHLNLLRKAKREYCAKDNYKKLLFGN